MQTSSRWTSILFYLVVPVSFLLLLSNLVDRAQMPSGLPLRQISLGLDLQGGSQFLLEVDRADILSQRLETMVTAISERLRDANIGFSGLSGTGQAIQLRLADPARLDDARRALQPLTQPHTIGLGPQPVEELAVADGGDGVLTFSLTDAGIDARLQVALAQSIDVLRRRVVELGNAEPRLVQQGRTRILVQVPGSSDPERLKGLINQAARLSFRLIDTSMSVNEALNGLPPAGSTVLFSGDDPAVPYLVEKREFVSGDSIIDSEVGTQARTGQSVVTFLLDDAGAARLTRISRDNVGKSFAIVLDDQVISVPRIGAPILPGPVQIAGNFSLEEASDIAALLRAGALPVRLTVLEERSVGPSLGADSIRGGVLAGVVALVLVMALMIGFYGVFGVMAVVGLAFNLAMIFAVLTLVGATLTLPGIAGIVLIIGVAVDANVLIYERIREEVRRHGDLGQAINQGLYKAMAAVFDANVTMLIVAAVLFFLGSSPVRGFALTLGIGVVATVFTAAVITPWQLGRWLDGRERRTLPRGIHTDVFDGATVGFMARRRLSFGLSAALSVAALVGIALHGVQLGIDFTGGSIIELRARQGDADLAEIRSRVGVLNVGEVQVQDFGDRQSVLLRVESQAMGESAEQSAVAKITEELNDRYEVRRTEVVGPAISGLFTRLATLGIVLSLGLILLYVSLRYAWQFAAGAVIATLHDVILTVGLFVITGVQFDLTSIAALLIVVGYSLNDTMVVYERLRSTMRRFPKMPLPMMIDTAINQTLSRTVLTAATTLLALLALVLFGGEVIRSFAFAMLFGVLVGSFSSIYIAAPVLIAFRLRPDRFHRPGTAASPAPDGKAGA